MSWMVVLVESTWLMPENGQSKSSSVKLRSELTSVGRAKVEANDVSMSISHFGVAVKIVVDELNDD